MKDNVYITGQYVLHQFIRLWRSKNIGGDVFSIPLARLTAINKEEKASVMQNLLFLMEAGLLVSIKPEGIFGSVVVLRVSYEAIVMIVERSFDFPHESSEQITDAILERFLVDESGKEGQMAAW